MKLNRNIRTFQREKTYYTIYYTHTQIPILVRTTSIFFFLVKEQWYIITYKYQIFVSWSCEFVYDIVNHKINVPISFTTRERNLLKSNLEPKFCMWSRNAMNCPPRKRSLKHHSLTQIILPLQNAPYFKGTCFMSFGFLKYLWKHFYFII